MTKKTTVTKATLEERVRGCVALVMGMDPDELCETDTLESVGADSLDKVEIVMAIEDEFGIVIPDRDAEKLETVGQLINYVRSTQ